MPHAILTPFNTIKAVLKKNKAEPNFSDAFVAEIELPHKPILLRRASLLTGKINSMVLPITMADIAI
jgi:hypothetical protein